MASDGRDAAVLEQGHPVGEHHGRGAVGDDQGGRRREHPAQRGLDEGLGVDVECRQRVVQDQDRGARGNGACERETLALAAGQAHALLADHRVNPLREGVDERGLGDLQRLGELLITTFGPPEHHVVAHRRREQRRVLEGHGDVTAQVEPGQVANVDAVEADGPAGHVVEPGREGRERGLAASREPHERHRLARFEG